MFKSAEGKILDSKGKDVFSNILGNKGKITKLIEYEFLVEHQRMSVIT